MRTQRITSLATTFWHGASVAVSTSVDGTLSVWDLDAGHLMERVRGPAGCGAYAVELTELDGRLLSISGWGDGAIRVHDIESRTPVGEALHGHTPRCYITALAVGELEGSPVVLSADTVGRIRTWDLNSHLPVGGPLSGHTPGLPVFSLTVAGDGGRTLLASGSRDGSAALWDLGARQQLWRTDSRWDQPNREPSVVGVAMTRIAGTQQVACAHVDGELVFRDLGTGEALNVLEGLPGFRALVGSTFEGTGLLSSAHEDGTVRYWESGALTSDHATINEGAIEAVAFAQMRGGSRPSVLIGSEIGRVGCWRIERGEKHGIEWLADGPADNDGFGLHPLMTALARRQVRVARGGSRTE